MILNPRSRQWPQFAVWASANTSYSGFLTTKADAIVAPIHPKGIRLF
jgi:hypothetical protein